MKRLSTADIDRLFGKAPPGQRRLILFCRRAVLRIIPRCNEYIKWDSLSYQKPEPDGAVKGGICQLSIRNGEVLLGFVHGAFLPDPGRVLKGVARAKRHVIIRGPNDIGDRRIVKLIRASEQFDPCRTQEHLVNNRFQRIPHLRHASCGASVAMLALALAWLVVLNDAARAIEADRVRHGPLDDHAVRVAAVLRGMDLTPTVRSNCEVIAVASQEAWREWFHKNRDEVLRLQTAVDELKPGDDRAALKKALAEKKRFMHTAPSLLRDPTSLRRALSKDQYDALENQLQRVKESMHDRKGE